jgi:hypothetical protein
MANPTVGIDITARLDNFLAEMAKLGPEAGKTGKDISRELNKSLKELAAAQRDVARNSKDAIQQTRGLGDAAGRTGRDAAKLAGVLDLLAPGAGSAARTVNDLADSLEVAAEAGGTVGIGGAAVAATFASLAIAAGGAFVAYQHFTEDSRRAEAATKDFAASNTATTAAFRRIDDAVIDAAASTGDWTAGTLRAVEASREIERSLAKVVDEQEAIIAKAKDLAQGEWFPADFDQFLGRISLGLGDMADALDELDGKSDVLKILTGSVDGLTTSTSELAAETWRARGIQVQATATAIIEAEVATDAAHADDEAAAAKTRRADATKRAADAAKKAADEERKRIEAEARAAEAEQSRIERSVQLLDQMDRARQEVVDSTLEGSAKIEADMRRQLSSAERLYQEELEVAVGHDQEMELAAERHQSHMAAIEAAGAQKLAAFRLDEAEKRAKELVDARAAMGDQLDEVSGYAQQALGAVGEASNDAYQRSVSVISSMEQRLAESRQYLTAAQEEEQEARIKSAKKAALEQFRVTKAAALAEATIAAALAVAKAVATGDVIGAIGAGVAGAAAIATIASESPPSFHAGGPHDVAPDESMARYRRGEFTLTPTGRQSIGDQQLSRANAGVPPTAPQVVAVSVYRHDRQVNRWKEDGLQAGDPIARAIRGTAIVGHRSNRG